ncbi:MAG: peptidoglycan-associated lipoprotein Pal [Rhodospirillales bacterium]
MPYKFLSILAAVALVAACETAPMEDSSSSGSGASSASSGSSVSSAAIVPGSQQDLVVNVGDRVFFEFDKFDLSAEARTTLEKQAAWLQTHRGVTVTVEGHADERGTREYNIGLGERRANSAKDYLVALGVNPDRITTVSYGEERPVAVGSNETAWAQNRRAVTVVTGAGS